MRKDPLVSGEHVLDQPAFYTLRSTSIVGSEIMTTIKSSSPDLASHMSDDTVDVGTAELDVMDAGVIMMDIDNADVDGDTVCI